MFHCFPYFVNEGGGVGGAKFEITQKNNNEISNYV